MTRPIYETNADRQRELSVAEIMAPILRSKMVKTRHLSPIDFIVQSLEGVATGLMEVKVRRYTPEELDTMGGFFLSEEKLMVIYRTAKILKMDFHLVVQTPICLLHLCFKDGNSWPRLERTFGGRFDRGDSKDAETLCLFPTTMFTRIDNDPAPVPARRT
jgi:hypothetical protein